MAPRPRAPLLTAIRALARGRAVGLEPVHELHRRLRRARLEGRLTGAPPPSAPLRELERALGASRDLSLFRLVLARAEPRGLRAADRRWRAVAYARARREEREAASRALVAARRAAAGPTGPSRGPRPPRTARARLRSGRRDAREALRRARAKLTLRRAHALRKELRRLGLLATLEGREPRGTASAKPAAVRRAVEGLGRLHDLDVALARLEGYPEGGERWRRRLERARTALEPEISRLLRSKALRRFTRGGRYP